MHKLKIVYCIILILMFGVINGSAQNSSSGHVSIGGGTDTGVLNNDEFDRKGPTNITYAEWQIDIDTDHSFDADFAYVNINRTIFRDENKKSGVFYYLPNAYSLNWDKESGYAFNVCYLSADDSGRGKVIITAELKPNITKADIELAKVLLKQNIKSEPGLQFKNLISLPLSGSPTVEFKQHFGESINDIQVNVSSDFLKPITVSWKMDRADDLFAALFNNIGLNGEIIFTPEGNDMPSSISIPIHLKLDSPETFGMILMEELWRGKEWKNDFPYPITLKNFHILKLATSEKPVIYSWDMGSVEVPENGRVSIDASLMPLSMDKDKAIYKRWMEYSIASCSSCNEDIKKSVLCGTGNTVVNNLEITVLSPLQVTGTTNMKIKIRSYQADPDGNTRILMPTITITQDGTTVQAGQLFMEDGKKPDYEFYIEMYNEDGTKYESGNWIKGNSLDLVIGKTQIKQYIPNFKDL